MRTTSTRALLLSWIAALVIALQPFVPSASAAEFARLPEPEWTAMMPANTSIEEDYKQYYFLGRRTLPVIADLNGAGTAYTFLYQEDRTSGKLKRIFKLLALDDATGRQKWIRTAPLSYNSFDIDAQGNVYYLDQQKSGNKLLYKLVALDSNNKQRWAKTFDKQISYSVLADGRILVILWLTGQNQVTLYSKDGQPLVTRKYAGTVRHVQGDYIGVANDQSASKTTLIDIYSLSTGKKIVTAVQPPDYFNVVHAEFDVLSGGTLLVPIYNAKTGVETLYGYSPDGKRKWSRVLPTPKQDGEYGTDNFYGTMYQRTIYDALFVSVGANYLVQEQNKLSLYDTNNQLIATRTFEDMPGQGTLQLLGSSIAFGATEKKSFMPAGPEPKKAAFYVMDAKTLNIQNSLVMEDALFNQADVRFYDAKTFYISTRERISKYVLP